MIFRRRPSTRTMLANAERNHAPARRRATDATNRIRAAIQNMENK